jgi:hypothetical protein
MELRCTKGDTVMERMFKRHPFVPSCRSRRAPILLFATFHRTNCILWEKKRNNTVQKYFTYICMNSSPIYAGCTDRHDADKYVLQHALRQGHKITKIRKHMARTVRYSIPAVTYPRSLVPTLPSDPHSAKKVLGGRPLCGFLTGLYFYGSRSARRLEQRYKWTRRRC